MVGSSGSPKASRGCRARIPIRATTALRVGRGAGEGRGCRARIPSAPRRPCGWVVAQRKAAAVGRGFHPRHDGPAGCPWREMDFAPYRSGFGLNSDRPWFNLPFGMKDRRHLRRLPQFWGPWPVYFLTVCARGRRPVLADDVVLSIVAESFRISETVSGWLVGRFVVMPDHIHFIASASDDRKSLSEFMRDWKRFTSRRICAVLGLESPLWQREFFDHLLRSTESGERRWQYILLNPVRAGLVGRVEDWPYQGEIHPILV